MPTWSNSLLRRVDECLSDHALWKPKLDSDGNGVSGARSFHLAVFVEPFLRFLLEGQKTVESRFSIHRRPPFESVKSRDIVLVKQSGGPIVAVAEVSEVWFYKLDPGAREFIRTRFGPQLCVEPDFWDRKAHSCYATLMQFSQIDPLPPINCTKQDRRGWVVLASPKDQEDLF